MKIVIPIVFYCKGGVERVISVLLHNRRRFGDSGRLRYSGNNLLGVEKVVPDLPSHSEPCMRLSPHTAPSLTVPLLGIQLDFLVMIR
jgi:hypothetical protein